MLINRSLLTPFPFEPFGVSVHISFTFSSTMLQCLSKAFTRASSLRLLRQDMSTCECDRVAVRRIDRGPVVSSCSSKSATSYSLQMTQLDDSPYKKMKCPSRETYVSSLRGFARSSLHQRRAGGQYLATNRCLVSPGMAVCLTGSLYQTWRKESEGREGDVLFGDCAGFQSISCRRARRSGFR